MKLTTELYRHLSRTTLALYRRLGQHRTFLSGFGSPSHATARCASSERSLIRDAARSWVARRIDLGDAGHMLRRLTQLVVGLFVLSAMFVGVVLGGMRSKSPPVLNAIRRFNRSVSNPRQMATAGSPGAYASVIRHIGRTSGQEYETPIGAIATEDGFVVALPYGASADWLKNLLASGSATIVDEGSTYRVDQPEVVTMTEAIDDFPHNERRMFRIFGVDKILRVRRSELQDTSARPVGR
jgi:deazaflavin-dependent oxidoreductase (nitroreductase family)